MQSGTLEIDLHGMTKVQAKAALDAALRRAGGSVYRVAATAAPRCGRWSAPSTPATPRSGGSSWG